MHEDCLCCVFVTQHKSQYSDVLDCITTMKMFLDFDKKCKQLSSSNNDVLCYGYHEKSS